MHNSMNNIMVPLSMTIQCRLCKLHVGLTSYQWLGSDGDWATTWLIKAFGPFYGTSTKSAEPDQITHNAVFEKVFQCLLTECYINI